jgi:DNA-binding NarL/FixJ family response regulator
MERRIQVSILSDSRLFRDAVSSRLALEDEIEVVGAAGTVYELLIRAQARPIDVLLVYLSIESAVTAQVVWDVKTLLPASRVIVLGCEEGNSETVRWIEAGALAYLEHGTSYASLVEAIQFVSEGRATCSLEEFTHVIRRIDELEKANGSARAFAKKALSDRETEVAQLMALGLVNKQIARRLGIKQPTVKTHVSNVLRKLQLKRRQEVIRRLQEGGTFEEG